MYIPLVSSWLESGTHNALERRKGGGGRGGGSKGGSRAGSSSSTSKGASISINSASGSTVKVKEYGVGNAKVSIIPSGQPFAGRSTGGGMRGSVFGTRQYGSGYPGTQNADVANRGFPFGFWPVTFGSGAGVAAGARYHTHEYGEPNNNSRPGGPLVEAPLQPKNATNTYRILADRATVVSLISSIRSNCTLDSTLITPAPYSGNDSTYPKPEQVIQYYRASSIALTLDGYNNSAVFYNQTNVPDTPLPSTLDAKFLACLNQTIGAAAPLLDNAATQSLQFSGLVGLAWMAVFFLRWRL